MGICRDQSTTYLKRLGYNVVRHPSTGIKPLQLIGRDKDAVTYLGGLDQLITEPTGALPSIEPDLVASEINGQQSSKLDAAIGLNILGSVIGAMGGNLGIKAGYENSRKIQFSFSSVLKDRVRPLDVGDYLRDGTVDADNIVLDRYVLGNGRLYLITEIVKSNKLGVTATRKGGGGLEIEIPVIQQLVGGEIKITADAASSSSLSYEGPEPLAFGFKCFEVGSEDGKLSLVAAEPGSIAMSFDEDGETTASPVILVEDQLLEFGG